MRVDLQLWFPVGILQIRVSQLCYRHPCVQGAHLSVSNPRWRDGSQRLPAGRCPLHTIHGSMLAYPYIGHGAGSYLGFGPSAYLRASVFGLRQSGALLEVDGGVKPLP